MEYCDGGSLEQRLKTAIDKKEKLSVKKELKPMMQGLTQALLYCQFKRVYHGDIKPSNILISLDPSHKTSIYKLGDLTNINKL